TDGGPPLVFDASDVGNYGVQNLVAIGKLSERCGTGAGSASVAQAELTAVLRRGIPVNDQPKSAYQRGSMVDQAAERVRRPLFILVRAVAFVLAIAAADVLSLLVGRVHAREGVLAGRSGLGAKRVLVMTEVALSLVLLIGAALLTRSFISLQQVRPGFDPANALTTRVTIPVVGRPQPLVDGARWSATFDQVMARLASAPGIA